MTKAFIKEATKFETYQVLNISMNDQSIQRKTTKEEINSKSKTEI